MPLNLQTPPKVKRSHERIHINSRHVLGSSGLISAIVSSEMSYLVAKIMRSIQRNVVRTCVMLSSLQDAFLARFRPKFLYLQLNQRKKSLLATYGVATQAHRDMLTKMPQRSLGMRKVEAKVQPSAIALLRQSLTPRHTALRLRDE